MLDADLAEIYGYSTKAFNQQVKNNIERFAEDFRFQLSEAEILLLSRSNFLTSIQVKGVKGGRSYKPYAFTEQGIYMLMTVLKGDLAIQQSMALIRLFKRLKDYAVSEGLSQHYGDAGEKMNSAISSRSRHNIVIATPILMLRNSVSLDSMLVAMVTFILS